MAKVWKSFYFCFRNEGMTPEIFKTCSVFRTREEINNCAEAGKSAIPGAGTGVVLAQGMAWWTDIMFLGRVLEERQRTGKEENIFVFLARAIRRVFYENLVDTLHVLLTFLTYAYLSASIVGFFFQQYVPSIFISLVSTFAEPYLGALGVYVVVNEIRRRNGHAPHPRLATVFVSLWFMFLGISTVLVYFEHSYPFNGIYRTIITNSFAAMVIRIGAMLR